MQTGENEQGLRKILDMTRLISIVVLIVHFYYQCYQAFKQWSFVHPIGDAVLNNIYQTGLLRNFHNAKLFALGFLLISLLGAKGRKDEKLNYKTSLAYIISGLLLYFIGYFFFCLEIQTALLCMLYISITSCLSERCHGAARRSDSLCKSSNGKAVIATIILCALRK
ncbi:YWFCY motif protein [Flavobacterium araucananum]|nr:YWFCY domain-containing protein [Flavobacterium araucananum]PWJ92109.1 YWFCY motif protein [Flavobacterium araucananum]